MRKRRAEARRTAVGEERRRRFLLDLEETEQKAKERRAGKRDLPRNDARKRRAAAEHAPVSGGAAPAHRRTWNYSD